MSSKTFMSLRKHFIHRTNYSVAPARRARVVAVAPMILESTFASVQIRYIRGVCGERGRRRGCNFKIVICIACFGWSSPKTLIQIIYITPFIGRTLFNFSAFCICSCDTSVCTCYCFNMICLEINMISRSFILQLSQISKKCEKQSLISCVLETFSEFFSKY